MDLGRYQSSFLATSFQTHGGHLKLCLQQGRYQTHRVIWPSSKSVSCLEITVSTAFSEAESGILL